MNWISVKDHLPTKEKRYLVTQNCSGHRIVTVARWSNDLLKLSKVEFYFMDGMNDRSGFWDSEPEWGKYQVSNVLAWCEVEPYEEE